MGRNLSNLFISQSYQFITQISGSELQDGLGNTINNLTLTASFADSANSASYALFATTASFALNGGGGTVDTGSLLVTASAAQNVVTFTKGDGSTFPVTIATGSAITVNTGSLLVTSSISNATITFTKGDGSTYTNTVNNVANATSASYALSSSYAVNATSAGTATTATSASYAATASYVVTALTASNTPNAVTTASVSNATITFTKGDASTFPVTVNNVTNATSASFALTASFAENVIPINTGSFYVSSSVSNATITFNQGDGTTEAVTVDNVANASSASFATTASYAVNATTAGTASFIPSNVNLNVASISASSAVFQSASIGFLTTITGSVVNIGDAYVVLNTSDATRYAGIKVEDSGSATPNNYTASFNFDSQTNDWFYEYSGSDPTNYGVAMFGPEYNTIGSPTYLTNNRLSKGNGGHHLNDSTITDDGVNVTFTTPIAGTEISASTGFSGNLTGTASFATTASFALNVTPLNTGSFLVTASVSNATITYTKGDGTTFNNTVNNVVNADSASLAASATSASFATTSVSSSFATSASFATTASFASSSPTPTLQQVTTAGATTNVAVTINNTASADYWLVDTKPFAKLDTDTIVAGRVDGADEDFILAGRNFNGTTPSITMTDGLFVYNESQHQFTGSVSLNSTLNVIGTATFGTAGGGLSVQVGDRIDLTGPALPADQRKLSQGALTSTYNSSSFLIHGGSGASTLTLQGTSGSAGIVISQDALVITGSVNISASVGSSNIIQNATDTFAGSTKVSEIVTCTQAEYETVSGSINAAATLYIITDNTGSGAYIEGAVQGNVSALAISSNTASLDCDAANFFTLTLVSGSDTNINPTNINAGQTINLQITQANPGNGTVSFPSSVKQVSGSAYVPTAASGPVDIVTLISFDGTSLFLSNVKNLV